MKRSMLIRGALLVTAASAGNAQLIAYAANLSGGTQSYRNRVISVSGIADTDNMDQILTRAEFAKMLVQASTYRNGTAGSQVAAANDVPASHAYASYIRTALRNGYMRTKLGGNFEPDSAVTLNDAVKAVLTLLGYTDEDFSGNVSEGRLAKFRSLELDEGVSTSTGTDSLTKQECVNILYNLLRTAPKSGSGIYGSFMDLSLSSDGEINANDLLEATMTGPVLVKTISALKDEIPFDLEEANLYYNGYNPGSYTFGIRYYESQLSQNGWLILYYNEDTKTVWAYGNDTGNNTYHCVKGEVDSIYYEADNVVTPSSVVIDGTEYSLNSADVKFMFSINGEIGVGDEVVLICKDNTTTNADGDELTDYYAVGVVLYNSGRSNTVGTDYSVVGANKYVVGANK